MTGINIQTPWSILLINNDKVVETRSYPLPAKYAGEELALIETPGKSGRFKSRIIGTITFSHSFKYESRNEWLNDYYRHLVDQHDENYGWKYYKPKYGWVVSNITKYNEPLNINCRKGIIFTTNLTK